MDAHEGSLLPDLGPVVRRCDAPPSDVGTGDPMLTVPRPYLLDVAAELWPGGPAPTVHHDTAGADAGAGQTFLAVPSASAPRLLLPVERRAAATALRSFGGRSTLLGRLRTGVVATVLSSGAGGLVFRDRVSVGRPGEGISVELAQVLGRPVQVALKSGPPRANRKPVLAVLDASARLLAFAKLGATPLTRTLVRVEAEALRLLSVRPLETVRVPDLLHTGAWGDMVLLVQEALPVRGTRSPRPAMLHRGMDEVARTLGTATAPWGTSEHAASVRARLPGIADSRSRDELEGAVAALAGEALPLVLGSWHGDWTPWNCTPAGNRLLVWDWERFASGVPLGFDALHYQLQQSLAAVAVPHAEQPRTLLRTAADLLAPFGVTAAQARLTARAYLVEIASRYLADDQAAAGAHVGEIGSWLLPVINEATAGGSPE